LQLVCERCGSREATPPPGQDVEAQALAQAYDLIRGTAIEGATMVAFRIAAALRAAQAEAERRAQEAEARLAEREKE
jgi:hypothetical protein